VCVGLGCIFFPDGTQLPLREPKTRGAGRHPGATQNPGNPGQAGTGTGAPPASRPSGGQKSTQCGALFRPGSQEINVECGYRIH
jgi:hypothetical protein